jgi:hypothetical protein
MSALHSCVIASRPADLHVRDFCGGSAPARGRFAGLLGPGVDAFFQNAR